MASLCEEYPDSDNPLRDSMAWWSRNLSSWRRKPTKKRVKDGGLRPKRRITFEKEES